MSKKPKPLDDAIFFHTAQIKIGTQLHHMGRLAPNTIWVVTAITTLELVGPRTYKTKSVTSVRTLRDTITLRQVGASKTSKDIRQGTFSYLSYSAIWRMT